MTSAITPSAPSSPAAFRPGRAAEEMQALARLYDQFGPVAYRVAFSITQNRDVAEQVVSDAFTTTWPRFRSDVSTQAFFLGLMSAVRSRAMQRRADRRGVVAFSASQVDGQSAREAWIASALGRLPEMQRQTLALAYFGGLGVGDIAAELRQPISHVKANLQAALRHLRSILPSAESGVPA